MELLLGFADGTEASGWNAVVRDTLQAGGATLSISDDRTEL